MIDNKIIFPMQSHFSLYRSHLEAVHFFWTSHLKKTSGNILDATLGQGKDTLYLAQFFLDTDSLLTSPQRILFGVDIQEQSLEKANSVLQKSLSYQSLNNIRLSKQCHSQIDYSVMTPLTLIIYNLGYLPSGDKSITTKTSTTLLSVEKSMNALQSGGMITITCYPGHEEGANELKALSHLFWQLPKNTWSVTHLEFAKENVHAPTLWIIQKSIEISTGISA